MLPSLVTSRPLKMPRNLLQVRCRCHAEEQRDIMLDVSFLAVFALRTLIVHCLNFLAMLLVYGRADLDIKGETTGKVPRDATI